MHVKMQGKLPRRSWAGPHRRDGGGAVAPVHDVVLHVELRRKLEQMDLAVGQAHQQAVGTVRSGLQQPSD